MTILDSGLAPSDATYITQTPNGTLTAEQALSALATGLLKNTTTTGVLSIAAADTDYVTPSVTTLSSLASIGTITTGVWNGTVLAGLYGGTGVANSGKTITLGGNLTTSGAYATTFTMTAATGVTFPTTGTLATLAGSEAFTNKTGNISQWTNDSGYLTSVTAHSVLSATHGDTLAASVVRGDLFIGNSTPKWSRLAIGAANTVLKSDGTDVSWNTSTGTGNNVLATSPTLTTPDIGVATATSVNKLTLTAPATSATLTIADGKTLTCNQTLTLTGTTGTTMTFPSTSATIARTDAAQTFTGVQTMTSPAFTTPTITTSLLFANGQGFYDTAADVIEQYRSTTAQTFNLYNTRTDASNYERLSINYSSNTAVIDSQKAGSGTARNLVLRIGGSAALTIGSGPSLTLSGTTSFNNNAISGASATTSARTSDGTEGASFVFVSNRGASATVTRTLATFVTPIWFTRIATQTLRIQPSSGKAFLRADGTVTTADKYLSLDSDGASVLIVYDGTNYVCLTERGTLSVQA
jgi:hypothetical protein